MKLSGEVASGSADSLGLWRNSILVFAVSLAWLVFLYRDTALDMATIWYRSETFNHGFIVFPIAFWLIWTRRFHLALLVPKSSFVAIPLLALVGGGWLLGDLASVNAVTQFAFVLMLVLLVPAVFGFHVAKAIAFPLFFMFFAVPVGEFAIPLLMEWTARFTVFAVRLTGIPVLQDGMQFVLSSGRWSVIEACSGVRYLIASTCVGTLYAYLNYVSLRRRLIFIAVSIVVPVVANWLRAYMIVMIGHLSNGKLAAGVDHLIYGWVFFGVVIMIMFMIGARWTEVEAKPEKAMTVGNAGAVAPALGVLALCTVILMLTMAAPHWVQSAVSRSSQGAVPKLAQISNLPAWAPGAPPVDWHPSYQNPPAELAQSFERAGMRIGLYVVFYRNQGYSSKLVTSTNTIVTSQDPNWLRLATRSREETFGGQLNKVHVEDLKGSDDDVISVWRWYWINGRLTSSDVVAKIYTVLSLLSGKGDDSAAIFVYGRKDAGGDEAIAAFVQDAAGPIENILRETSAKR